MQSFTVTVLSHFSADAGDWDKAKEVNRVGGAIIHMFIMKRVEFARGQKRKPNAYISCTNVGASFVAPQCIMTYAKRLAWPVLPMASTTSRQRQHKNCRKRKEKRGVGNGCLHLCSIVSGMPALTLYWTTHLTVLSFVPDKYGVVP